MYRNYINADLKGLVEQYGITIQNGALAVNCPPCVRDSLSAAMRERAQEVIFCIRMLQTMQRKADIESLDGYPDIENAMLALVSGAMDLDAVLSAETNRFERRQENASLAVPPDTDPHPQTSAFLEALRYSLKPNVMVSEIGHQAVERILNREEYSLVIADMYRQFQVLQDQFMAV